MNSQPSSAHKMMRHQQSNLSEIGRDENRSKTGLDMSHILEDPELAKSGH